MPLELARRNKMRREEGSLKDGEEGERLKKLEEERGNNGQNFTWNN